MLLSLEMTLDGLEMGGWVDFHSDGIECSVSVSYAVFRRLYCKGRVLGHKRAKRNTRPNTSLIQIEGVPTKEDAQFYLGKVRSSRFSLLHPILTCYSWEMIESGICVQGEAGDSGIKGPGNLGVSLSIIPPLYEPILT
jgi:Ribosomal protein L35Ae